MFGISVLIISTVISNAYGQGNPPPQPPHPPQPPQPSQPYYGNGGQPQPQYPPQLQYGGQLQPQYSSWGGQPQQPQYGPGFGYGGYGHGAPMPAHNGGGDSMSQLLPLLLLTGGLGEGSGGGDLMSILPFLLLSGGLGGGKGGGDLMKILPILILLKNQKPGVKKSANDLQREYEDIKRSISGDTVRLGQQG